ncbi:MAG TPA: transposase [Lacipirellulaceae bacterium]
MAQSLSNVILHLVFSTKNRRPWIGVEIETELFKYLAGTLRDIKCPSQKIGGADDHIHIACTLARDGN